MNSSGIPDASANAHGLMSAADYLKVAALGGTNTGDVTIGAQANGLSIAGQILSLAVAGASQAGALSTGAQEIAGAKTFLAQMISDFGIKSSLGTTVMALSEASFRVGRGATAISLNEAGGGSSQIYNGLAGLEVTTRTNRLYGVASLSTDVANKIGTQTPAASVDVSAKLLSIRDGIGGTEAEYAFFKRPSGSFGVAILTLDQKLSTNNGGLAIIAGGAGETGIFFEGPAAAGGVTIGLGSAGTRGLMTQATNRTQSWYVNAGVYSGSARALFDWEANGDTYQKTIPFTRYQADAAHAADLARWYLGSTLRAALGYDGVMHAESYRGNNALNIGMTATTAQAYLFYAGAQLGVSSAGGYCNTGFDAQSTIRLGTNGEARPAAGAATRGTIWYSKSASSAADTLEVCVKSAADSYSWVTIATG